MWHDKLIAKFESNAKAADGLFKHWKKKAPSEVAMEKRASVKALANRIGSLHREGDKTGWWEARPVLRQLLADLLMVEQHVIFERATPASVLFPEFPGLPALEANELPCRLGARGSLLEIVVAKLRNNLRSRTWVVAPPGSGKSLAVRLLGARHSDEVLAFSAGTLREVVGRASESADGRAVVAEVESTQIGADLEALEALSRQPRSLILLAPFDSPIAAPAAGPPSGDDHNPRGWVSVDGSPPPGWRPRMVRWIVDRLERSTRDSKLDVEDVERWITGCDVHQHAIRTPGDLLALCADLDEYLDEKTLQGRAQRWLETIASGWWTEDAPRTWREHAGKTSFAAAVAADFLDTSIASNRRQIEQWANLLPKGLAPSSVDDVPGAEMAVSYMRSAGLLRRGEHGVEPYPRWVGDGVIGQTVRELLEASDLDRWGLLAADESRRAHVDAALDALSPAAFESLLERVTREATRTPSLAHVACVEAVVAAAARRMHPTDVPSPRMAGVLQRLLQAAIGHAASIDGTGIPTPLTRRDRDEWCATCWTISFAVPPPTGWRRGDMDWVVPGWTRDLKLAEIPRLQLPSSTFDPMDATPAVRALAKLAPRLVNALKRQQLPADVPRLLLPAFFLADRDWGLDAHHLDDLHGSWDERELAREAATLPQERRERLARRMWQLVGVDSIPIAGRIEYLMNRHPGLVQFVLDNLPASDVSETARTAGTHRRYTAAGAWVPSDPTLLRRLPTRSANAAIEGWLAGAATRDIRFDEARELAPILDVVERRVLLDVLRSSDRDVAAEFASFVWSRDPDLAFEEARLALERELASSEGWFHLAPREYLGRLADLILGTKSPPAWASTWAYRRLLDAGPASERIFVLARGEPPPRDTPSRSVETRRRRSRGKTK